MKKLVMLAAVAAAVVLGGCAHNDAPPAPTHATAGYDHHSGGKLGGKLGH